MNILFWLGIAILIILIQTSFMVFLLYGCNKRKRPYGLTMDVVLNSTDDLPVDDRDFSAFIIKGHIWLWVDGAWMDGGLLYGRDDTELTT